MIYPSYDPGIKRTIKNHFDRFYSLSLENFTIKDVDFVQRDQERFVVHDCRG
jgi:formylmethanofuran dehydrogenase subunit A